jgi:3-hydroxybutyryl-CoA dehydratase
MTLAAARPDRGLLALAPAPQQPHAAAQDPPARTGSAAGAFTMEHGLYLEDLQPGMSAVFGKTITDADILMFAGVSGDTNPVHLNEEFAGGTVFKGRIAHGLLTASLISTAIGTKLPGPGAVYLSQTMKFLAPVRAGETVRAVVTIKSVDLERRRVTMETVCRVAGRDVVTGEAVIMVPRRPQQAAAAE